MSVIKHRVKDTPVSDGAGVKINRVIGQPMLQRLDPFLMLDEFGSDSAEDYLAGFPMHPHRGFQTVTYMLNGKMGHKDSAGNKGSIEDGGLQWMNAGRGIIHEEMPQQEEGRMRGFKLWVNLPSIEKMSNPEYEDIPSAEIPEIVHEDGNKVRVLAGNFSGVEGAVRTHAVKPQFFDVHMPRDNAIVIPTIDSHNGFIYIYEGAIKLDGKALNKGELAALDLTQALNILALEQAKLIFVSGEPIDEPVVQYGPFVMNSESEIQQAISDFQSGVLA